MWAERCTEWLRQWAFGPDDRTTPAIEKADGGLRPHAETAQLPHQPAEHRRTGPIRPIQGILFGPAAFVTIPIGCVIGGGGPLYSAAWCRCARAVTDARARQPLHGQVVPPGLHGVRLLVPSSSGVVLMYTPGRHRGEMQALGLSGPPSDPATWAIYAVVFRPPPRRHRVPHQHHRTGSSVFGAVLLLRRRSARSSCW